MLRGISFATPSRWLFRRFTSQLKQNHHAKPQIDLRDYQKDCISEILSSLTQIHKPAVSLPTGSGKTVIFCSLIPQVKAQAGQGSKTLVLVNRKEIAHQTIRTINNLLPDLKVGLEMGKSSYEKERDVDVCVASIHTIHKDNRLDAFDPSEFKLVIVDEAHHAASETYHKTLAHFGIDEDLPNVYCVGVSATFFRKDKRSLQIFDKVVYHREATDMIDRGHLCKVQVSQYDFEIPPGYTKTKQPQNFLFSPTGCDLIFKLWQESEAQSTVIFCISKAHIAVVMSKFRSCGIDARSITGDDTSDIRNKTIEGFKNREFPVLINCAVLTEGTDIPCIDQIIFATPLGSPGLAMQMIGRGLRNYPGKELCNTIFFTPMVSFNTATGLLPELRGLTDVKQRDSYISATGEKIETPTESPDKQPGHLDLLGESSIGELDESKSENLMSIFQKNESNMAHPLAWLKYDRSLYLSLPPSPMTSAKLLKLEYSRKQWHLIAVHSYPKTAATQRGFKNITVASSPDFKTARDAADDLIRSRFFTKLSAQYFHPRARWRQQEPTPSQLSTLEKFGLSATLDHLNKGQATILLGMKICGGLRLYDHKVNDSLDLGIDLDEK